MPPSTTRSAPVIHRARSEHKNPQASQTSSGVPIRPRGTAGPPRHLRDMLVVKAGLSDQEIDELL